MDFLNIEINQNLYIKILVISIAMVIVYLALTMSSLLVVRSYNLGPNTTVVSIEPGDNIEDVEEGHFSAHIDLIESDSKTIEVAGWAFIEGEKLEHINCSYVLKNQETGKMYKMRTQMEENINLVEEEHKMSGLHARSLSLGMPKGMYDIYILYHNNNEDLLAFTLIPFELK